MLFGYHQIYDKQQEVRRDPFNLFSMLDERLYNAKRHRNQMLKSKAAPIKNDRPTSPFYVKVRPMLSLPRRPIVYRERDYI